MPRFSYRARNAQGQLVEGHIEAGDRALAIQLIEQKRCVPIKIEAEGESAKSAPAKPSAALTQPAGASTSALPASPAPAVPAVVPRSGS